MVQSIGLFKKRVRVAIIKIQGVKFYRGNLRLEESVSYDEGSNP